MFLAQERKCPGDQGVVTRGTDERRQLEPQFFANADDAFGASGCFRELLGLAIHDPICQLLNFGCHTSLWCGRATKEVVSAKNPNFSCVA